MALSVISVISQNKYVQHAAATILALPPILQLGYITTPTVTLVSSCSVTPGAAALKKSAQLALCGTRPLWHAPGHKEFAGQRLAHL